MSQSVARFSVFSSSGPTNCSALPEMGSEEPPPKSHPRVRLEIDARRAQLLELGRELFMTHRYEDLSIGDIAQAAGISKGLLYHYFPSKRSFYSESLRAVAYELLRDAMPPPNLPPIERLRAGVDAFFAFIGRHRPVFAALIQRGILRDPEVIGILEDTKLRFLDRLLTEFADARISRNALSGWIGFVAASVLDWFERPDVTERELADLSTAVFKVFQRR